MFEFLFKYPWTAFAKGHFVWLGFGPAWVRGTNAQWIALKQARFTASNSKWEAKETIDAEIIDGQFRLLTGGETVRKFELGKSLVLEANWKAPVLPFLTPK